MAVRRRAAATFVLGGISMLLAGVPASAARPAVDSPPLDVRIVDFAFEPEVVEVTVGTVVRWTNDGDELHTVTSDSGRFLSDEIPYGESYEHRFDATGTYAYHCSLHDEMRATIEVVAGRTTTSTATAASTTPTTSDASSPTTATPPSTVSTPPALADTGAPTGWLLVLGFLLCAAGAAGLLRSATRPALSAPIAPSRPRVDDPLAGPGA